MNKRADRKISIIIPAKNEADSLHTLIPKLQEYHPEAEILVVNDGSSDDTKNLDRIPGVRLLNAPYNQGNGAAIKRGARAAEGDIFIFMDADGQHQPEDIDRLLNRYRNEDLDMVVGARGRGSQASIGRSVANKLYNRMASMMTGHKIPDLTSGFRVVDGTKFREFLHLLPNGFSYPTTVTMAFFRSGYTVGYEPIEAPARKGNGKSHIRPLKDGMRFLVIIFKIGSLYSPLKLFLPISILNFLAGVGLYVYTYLVQGRFTNMSALLLSTALLVFLIGLVSEQITALMFSRRERGDHH